MVAVERVRVGTRRFNEAACKEAEKRKTGRGIRTGRCGFNEAACKEAEKQAGPVDGRRPLPLASMRPPAKRRKNRDRMRRGNGPGVVLQ